MEGIHIRYLTFTFSLFILFYFFLVCASWTTATPKFNKMRGVAIQAFGEIGGPRFCYSIEGDIMSIIGRMGGMKLNLVNFVIW